MSGNTERDRRSQGEFNNNGKTALVTGSATGIGANIAVDLATAGYQVIVTGRNYKSLSAVVDRCNKVSGARHCARLFVADLFDIRQVDELIDFVAKQFDRLDILVNNACCRADDKGILAPGSFDDMKHVMWINVSVPLYLIHKCLVPLRSSNLSSKSIVINISSIASQVVVPLHLYSISKTCLSEMSRTIAEEAKELNFLSIAISPGPVLTDERPHHIKMSNMTLMNRVGSTQEVSNFVMFVIENAHLFNGRELSIDGGYLAKQKQPTVRDETITELQP